MSSSFRHAWKELVNLCWLVYDKVLILLVFVFVFLGIIIIFFRGNKIELLTSSVNLMFSFSWLSNSASIRCHLFIFGE